MFGLVCLATVSACFADYLVIGLSPKPLNIFCVVQMSRASLQAVLSIWHSQQRRKTRDWLLRSFAGIIRPKATPPTPNLVQLLSPSNSHPIGRLQFCHALLDCLVGNLTLADLLSRAEFLNKACHVLAFRDLKHMREHVSR